jgi:FtsH-binding integral membrane protein
MPNDVMTWPEDRRTVDTLGVNARATFISRTYTHLFIAILAFVGVIAALFQTSIPQKMIEFLAGGGYRWLLFLGAFMVVGMLASRTAFKARTKGAQYLALLGYVVAEALLFLPLLYMAHHFAGGGVIQSAALVTLLGFAGLTAVVMVTRKDFSFLRGIVMYGGIVALLVIVGGVAFGLNLGTWFSIAMVGLAGASILWETSNVLHRYPEDKYVAASLSLFASVALMFWYVLQLFLSSDS